MRVQRMTAPDSGEVSYTVVGADGLPVAPVESYLHMLAALGRSPNTVRAYAHDLKLYFEFLEHAGVVWHAADLNDVVDFVAWLREPGDNVIAVSPAGWRRSPATINRAVIAVERFYDYQHRAGHPHALSEALRTDTRHRAARGFFAHIAREGRASRFLRVRETRRRPRTLEPLQVRAVLDGCVNVRDLLLLSLLYDTGMRVGAALGLRHSDVDPRRGVVRIVDRWDNSNGMRTKGSSGQVCASPEWFRLYHRYMHELYRDLDCDYVFVNLWREPVGRPMTYAGVRECVVAIRRRTGIDFTPHMLRHTHATELQKHQVPLEIISKRLLHKSIATTSDQYVHLTPADMRLALQRSGFWTDEVGE